MKGWRCSSPAEITTIRNDFGKRLGSVLRARAFSLPLYNFGESLDDAGVDVIVVQGVPNDEAWWAVADRLRRGSTE